MSEKPRVFDARLHILDRQILDASGTPVATVDDLELTDVVLGEPLTGREPAPTISNLLSGSVLATRIFGGRPPSSRWYRVGWHLIHAIDETVDLTVEGDTLDVTWVERWVRDHIVGKIPGGKHDPE
jgi:hypothetical protein